MLSVKNLTKTYSSADGAERKALDGVTVDFPARGTVFVVGKNGSGKSALLRVLGGLETADGGEIVCGGESREAADVLLRDRSRFVFRGCDLLSGFSVEENIALALRLRGGTVSADAVGNILAQAGAEDLRGLKPRKLSPEQKLRGAVALALAAEPQILIADGYETRSSATESVYRWLGELGRDRLVIASAKDRGLAEKYGDRIIELDEGKVVAYIAKAAMPVKQDKSATAAAVRPRSKLPFASALKLGAGLLKKRCFLLVISVCAAAVACGMFGAVSAMAMYDGRAAAEKSLAGTAYNAAVLSRRAVTYDKTTAYRFENGRERRRSRTDESEKTVFIGASEVGDCDDAELGLHFAGVFGLDTTYSTEARIANYAADIGGADYYRYDGAYGFTDAGGRYMTETFGADALLAGAYPTGEDQAAVSEYMYEVFAHYGLRAYDSASKTFGPVQEFSSPRELVGKQVVIKRNRGAVAPEEYLPLTVSGVYRTVRPDGRFAALKEPGVDNAELSREFSARYSHGFANLFYVSPAFRAKYAVKSSEDASGLSRYSGMAKTPYVHVGDYENKTLPFVLPEWLAAAGDVRYFTFPDGGESATAEPGDGETYISLAKFVTEASSLAYAETAAGTYMDARPDFGDAFRRAFYLSSGKWEGDGGPPEDIDLAATLSVLMPAIADDWDRFVGTRPHFTAFDRLTSSDGWSLRLAGVYASETYSGGSGYLIGRSFLDKHVSDYSYGVTQRDSGYAAPEDAVYASVITPLTGGRGALSRLFALGEMRNYSYYVLTDNPVFDEALALQNRCADTAGYATAGAILAVISLALLCGCFSAAFSAQSRDLAILRSLGARRGDRRTILLSAAGVVALIAAALAVATALVVCAAVTPAAGLLDVVMLGFGPANAAVAACCAALAVFLSALPALAAADAAPPEPPHADKKEKE